MPEETRDKTGRWAVALAVFAFVSLGYFYYIAHRLDWVQYVTQSYYWRVMALSCPNKDLEAVVVLSEQPGAEPKHVLHYDPSLAQYLKTLPVDQPVKVEIKRKGYLWEFNYGEQYVLAVGSKGIYHSWRKVPAELKACSFEPKESLDPALLVGTKH